MAQDRSDPNPNDVDTGNPTQDIFTMSGMPVDRPIQQQQPPRTVDEAMGFNNYRIDDAPEQSQAFVRYEVYNMTVGTAPARIGTSGNKYRGRIRVSANGGNGTFVVLANNIDSCVVDNPNALAIAAGATVTIEALGDVYVAAASGTVNVQAIEEFRR